MVCTPLKLCMAMATAWGIMAGSRQPRGLQHRTQAEVGVQAGSTARAERTWCVEHAGFVRLDLSVWVFSKALDDPHGSCVRPRIALLEQGACLQV